MLGLITRFVLAAAIGLGGALGVAAMTAAPKTTVQPGTDSTDFALTAETGDQTVAFGLTGIPDQAPVVLQALPDDKTIQLVSFVEAGGLPPGADARPAWLAPTGFPRIPPISQFDGSPLANKNCTMASGAMLARLGFGIRTTGGQLRALSGDTDGGTTLGDLQTAVSKWGVHFNSAAITPLQLRALLYAGAGAVIQVTYGKIPSPHSLQPSFTGGHAIYLDGFRPTGTDGEAAFYVIDPLGTGAYKGRWIPAGLIEGAALDFGGGRIYTSWAFPGGKAPTNPPALPPSGYPTPEPGATPTPTPEPGATANPTATPALPTDDPNIGDPPSGDTPVEVPSDVWIPHYVGVTAGGVTISPLLTACLVNPAAWCPTGIIGVWPAAATAPPSLPPLLQANVNLLYANAIGSGLMQVIFEVPDGSTPGLQFWDAKSASGPLMAAPSIEAGMLDGKVVQIATFPVQQGISYHFVASAQAAGLRAISQVATAAQ